MSGNWKDMSRAEILAMVEEHRERLKQIHSEADFLVYAIESCEKHLAGHSELATVFGGKCSCEFCKLDRNWQ